MDWKDILSAKVSEGGLPQPEDSTPAPADPIPAKDILHVSIDRKGHKGKTATIIDGFTSGDDAVASLASTLKQRLGLGGSARGGEILIQGNVADKVKALLTSLGYKVV